MVRNVNILTVVEEWEATLPERAPQETGKSVKRVTGEFAFGEEARKSR